MTREELKAHCKKAITTCEAVWAEDEEKLKNHKLYQEHKLMLELLEQEPCDDCVSRQAVLDALDSHKYSDEFCKEHHIDWSINLGMAHIAINELPHVTPIQRWIPVSERLPEKSTWVLVTCKNPDGYIYLDIKLINRYTGLWDGDEDFIGTVLAWMPLLEPYKVESGGK